MKVNNSNNIEEHQIPCLENIVQTTNIFLRGSRIRGTYADKLVDYLSEIFNAEMVSLMLIDQINSTRILSIASATDLEDQIIYRTQEVVPPTQEKEVKLVKKLGKREDGSSEYRTSSIIVPLEVGGLNLGKLCMGNRKDGDFSEEDVSLLKYSVGPVISAHIYALLQKENTLLVLNNALQARDGYTLDHSWRVTQYTIQIARELGHDLFNLIGLRFGTLLHDIGKIGVPDDILNKPSRLNDEEMDQMRRHPEKGNQIFQKRDMFDKDYQSIILHHHERWDGKGYPHELYMEKIPEISRPIPVADTFDALVSDRPYRDGIDTERAFNIIKEGKGTQFHPESAQAFLDIARDLRIVTISDKKYHQLSCRYAHLSGNKTLVYRKREIPSTYGLCCCIN